MEPGDRNFGDRHRHLHSTQAVAQVTLSEAGINHAFQAEQVKKRLVNLSLPALRDLSGAQLVSFEVVQLQLLPNNRVQIWAKADLSNGVAWFFVTRSLKQTPCQNLNGTSLKP